MELCNSKGRIYYNKFYIIVVKHKSHFILTDLAQLMEKWVKVDKDVEILGDIKNQFENEHIELDYLWSLRLYNLMIT